MEQTKTGRERMEETLKIIALKIKQGFVITDREMAIWKLYGNREA